MKNMNKLFMFVWVVCICSIWGVILFIGFKDKDKEYENLTTNLKQASTVYMKDKNIDLKLNDSIKIFVDDLIKDNYIKEDEINKDYCVDSIVVSRDFFNYDYKINKECK